MITTTDGHKCKRGERVWEIGRDISSDKLSPVRSTVHGGQNDVANPNLCWKSYDLCKEYCDKENKKDMSFTEYMSSGQFEGLGAVALMLFKGSL